MRPRAVMAVVMIGPAADLIASSGTLFAPRVTTRNLIRANSRDAHRAAFEQTLDAIAPRLAKLVDLALIAPR